MAASTVASIILAAGAGSRFGKPKQLLTWEGQPLVTHAVDTAWMAGLEPVVVVLGAAAGDVAPVLASRPVQVVRNYRWEEGLSSSLHTGLAALPAGTEAAIFMPIDQPLITPRLLQQLVARWQESGCDIVVPRTVEGQQGSPVLFSSRYFAELAALRGDVGGRVLLERYADRVAYLTVDDPQALMDIDTPDAYQRLQNHAASGDLALRFGEIRGLICDMDGVLWRGDDPLPGLGDLLSLLHDRRIEYVWATNNSSRTPEEYIRKLAGMGVTTTGDHILTAAVATARHVAETYPGAAVFSIGGNGVREALVAEGLRCSEDLDVEAVDVVVVGWDQQLTWRKLATATRLILNGAPLIGTNPDLTFPLEKALAPGNGAQIAALKAATGVEPEVIGKPAPPLYQQALARMGTAPDATLVIGDRLDTDILGGVRLGMPTALVLTGVSHREELATSPIRPTAVFEDLAALIATWRAATIGGL
jgi:4-nitrophenyl phosphatase